ncbi:unnamed protein product [Pylaiella littoralis]
MEAETSSGLVRKQNDDVEVDHYFLPGGILDTHQEEDMIGGSLLDEIGGVGNVTALLPSKQMTVSRIVGSDTRPVASAGGTRPQQLHRKAASVISAGSTRLSVEGTNPMAKEFTPSACSIPADIAVEAHPGGPHPHPRRSATKPSNRVFSAAVGSEVKTTAVEQPPYHTAMQIQLRKLPRPLGPRPEPGPVPPRQARELLPAAVQVSPEDLGQQQPSHQSGGTSWPIRANTVPIFPGPPVPSKQQLGVANRAHLPSPPGFPPRGVQHRKPRMQGQASGVSPVSSQRRDRVVLRKHHGGKFGQNSDGPWDPNGRVPTSKAGAQYVGNAHAARPQQLRNRNVAPFPRVQPHERVDNRIGTITKDGSSIGRDRVHAVADGRTQRLDQNLPMAEGSSRNPTQTHQRGVDRIYHGEGNNDPKHDAQMKASSRRQDVFVEHTVQPTVDSPLKSAGDDSSLQSTSSLSAMEPGQEFMLRQASGRLASTVEQEGLHDDLPSDDESSFEVTVSTETSQEPSSDRWIGNSSERNARQAKAEDESASHLQSHVNKEKDKAKLKKKDDKVYRAPTKQLLGTPVKESSRAKMGTRSSLSQRFRLLGGYVRSLSFGIVIAIVRIFTRQLNRLRLVRRMLALMSFAASWGVSLLSVSIMSTSWLLLLGLRLHSLALKEVTGSVHVAVCFLFPYCFQYLVSAIDEWAPHWLPSCLWYSFLMQMFCTSNHQYKHSMSSHLVPALRALLPVAFLCEVPSGRSYLLALSGSELLLLSFTLAAVRLRCIFSPIFLLSWASQVFALATCGSSASLQYGQLLVSLASLHAVSMVDVMLNSRFYHARSANGAAGEEIHDVRERVYRGSQKKTAVR